VVRTKHTGEDARVDDGVETVIFPPGIPIAQVGVEVNRSMEITGNHWFSCKVITTRNVVDTAPAVTAMREELYEESLEFIDNKVKEAIEEVST